MDNVCQRLNLQQPDLFGLKYVSRFPALTFIKLKYQNQSTFRRSYPKIRWVDLDRPLKKQLDKKIILLTKFLPSKSCSRYSTEPYLYLGVIFYVTDVSLLDDEVTRFHYFLQARTFFNPF